MEGYRVRKVMARLIRALLTLALIQSHVEAQTAAKKTNLQQCGVSSTWFPLVVSNERVNEAQYPWMAALYVFKDHANSYDFLCTTTLISNRHVITAGHCVQYDTIVLYDNEDLILVFGKTDLTNWARDSVVRQVAQIASHPNYTQDQSGHDLVVFTLNKPIKFSISIYPICLWNVDWGVGPVQGTGVVAGWGKTKVSDTYSVIPYKAQIPMVGIDDCKASHAEFPARISNYSLCAGEKNGEGPCGGDTGAGFVTKIGGFYYLRGVVSYMVPKPGRLCDLAQYVIFADLAREIDWIKSVIAIDDSAEVVKPVKKKVELNFRLNLFPDTCGTNSAKENALEPLKEGHYPWAVGVSVEYKFKCMGTLLSERHVITAAQCVRNYAGEVTSNFRFSLNFRRFSDGDIETGGVLRIALNKEYTRPTESDVAVLIMFMPVTFNEHVKPICLWDGPADVSEVVGEKGLVLGYTNNEHVEIYKKQQENITMPIVSKEKCLETDPRYTTLAPDRTFCAGNRNASMPLPCTGHAGAGFLMKRNGRWTLRGLLSAALPTEDFQGCDPDKYAVFVDLAYYKKWIYEQMKIQ